MAKFKGVRKLSQAKYDELLSQGLLDPDILYVTPHLNSGGSPIEYTTEEALEDEANLESDTYYATDDDDEDIDLSTAEAIQQEIAQKTKRYLTESWVSSDSSQWYNIYNDGWKECGIVISNITTDETRTVTLPTAFTNSNYIVSRVNYSDSTASTGYRALGITSKTNTSITLRLASATNKTEIHCCGY